MANNEEKELAEALEKIRKMEEEEKLKKPREETLL